MNNAWDQTFHQPVCSCEHLNKQVNKYLQFRLDDGLGTLLFFLTILFVLLSMIYIFSCFSKILFDLRVVCLCVCERAHSLVCSPTNIAK